MRKIVLWLLAVLFLASIAGVSIAAPGDAPGDMPASLSIQAEDKVVDAEWQLTPPVVDGDLSDWDGYARYYLDDTTADYPPPSQRPTPDDLSAWTSIVWDTDYLYIALYVVDDIVVRNHRDWRQDDMAGFSFDVDRDNQTSLADVRLTLSPDNLVTLDGGYRLGVQSVTRIHKQGWQMEVAVPLHEFGSDFLTDAQVGFTWGVQDNDNDGPLSWLSWAGPSFVEPTPQQGLLRFVNGPTRDWITIRPGVEGYDGMVDSILNGWNPDVNDGENPVLNIRGKNQWHLVMRFEPPELPPGARALRARIHYNVIGRSAESWSLVRMYRLLSPWDEATVTWDNADATTRWAKRGANAIGVDRSDVVIDAVKLDRIGVDFVWDFSSEIADLYAHPENNFGFIFRAEEGTNMQYNLQSSECGPTCAPWIEIFVEFPPPTAQADDMNVAQPADVIQPEGASN